MTRFVQFFVFCSLAAMLLIGHRYVGAQQKNEKRMDWQIKADEIDWQNNPIVLGFPGNPYEQYTIDAIEAHDAKGHRFWLTWKDTGKTFRDHWDIRPVSYECSPPDVAGFKHCQGVFPYQP